MRRAGIALLLAAGCGGAPPLPPPDPGAAQVAVHLGAACREGARAKGDDGGYAGLGARFEAVDYHRLRDIAVVLTGPGLPKEGPAPTEAALAIGERGFDRDLVLLAPGGRTRLTISNRRSGPLSLFCMAGKDGFDLTLPPGGSAAVTLREPGLYELLCAEDDALRGTILVAPTPWCAQGDAGGRVVFRGLPPGRYETEVVSARLPRLRRTLDAKAGAWTELDAVLTVNDLACTRPGK